MGKYRVRFEKHWIEYGEVVVDAPDEDEARDAGLELLLDSDDSIEWGEMDAQDMRVESVEEQTP